MDGWVVNLIDLEREIDVQAYHVSGQTDKVKDELIVRSIDEQVSR